jgi:hypothetical protein
MGAFLLAFGRDCRLRWEQGWHKMLVCDELLYA